MSATFKIQKNFDLSKHNTFGLRSIADHLIEIHELNQIEEVAKYLKHNSISASQIRFLGGGSNLILPEKIHDLVIRPMFTGKKIIKEDNTHYFVQVGAAENWHEFVQWSLEHSFYGLENLALIPGLVGSAPIQNIGAYGVEVKDFIEQILIFDFATNQFQELSNLDCQFQYRHSVFKEKEFQSAMLCQVVFKLNKVDSPKVDYKDVQQALAGRTNKATAAEVCAAVIEVRSKKLPDPKVIGNVGSFFKNPIVTEKFKTDLQARFPNLVSYRQPDGSYKLAAAWLIDQCGFKERVYGQVRMHQQQALVMVNLGAAEKSDVMALKNEIQKSVFSEFNVHLDPEPVFW